MHDRAIPYQRTGNWRGNFHRVTSLLPDQRIVECANAVNPTNNVCACRKTERNPSQITSKRFARVGSVLSQ